MISLLLINCDSVTLTAVSHLLACTQDIELLAENGEFYLQPKQPDTIVMGGGSSPCDTQQILTLRQIYPQSRLILLLDATHISMMTDITQMPVEGCLWKHEINTSLIHMIRAVAAGATLISQAVIAYSVMQSTSHSTPDHDIYLLTRAEWQTIELLAQGLDNQQIQSRLQIATSTLRNRISSIYDKLGLNSRGEAIVWFQRHTNEHR